MNIIPHVETSDAHPSHVFGDAKEFKHGYFYKECFRCGCMVFRVSNGDSVYSRNSFRSCEETIMLTALE